MTNNTSADDTRPLLVTLLAGLLFLQGAIRFCIGAYTLSGTIFVGIVSLFGTSTTSLGGVFFTAITWLVSGLIYLLFAAMVWSLKPWAYWATLVLAALSLLADIITLMAQRSASWLLITSMILSAIVFIGFLTPNVRAAFTGERRVGQETS